MIKKSLYEELIIHIGKEELAKLLGADTGFSVQNTDEEDGEIRFILSRKTTIDEPMPHAPRTQEQGKRRDFL
jgi:hypothetical protein